MIDRFFWSFPRPILVGLLQKPSRDRKLVIIYQILVSSAKAHPVRSIVCGPLRGCSVDVDYTKFCWRNGSTRLKCPSGWSNLNSFLASIDTINKRHDWVLFCIRNNFLNVDWPIFVCIENKRMCSLRVYILFSRKTMRILSFSIKMIFFK